MSDTSHPQTPVPPTATPEARPTEVAPAKTKPTAAERLKATLAKLGPVGIGIYLFSTLLLWLPWVVVATSNLLTGSEGVEGFNLDRLGFDLPPGASLATLGALTWGFSKLTQAPRIALALVLAPLLVKIPFVARLSERATKLLEKLG